MSQSVIVCPKCGSTKTEEVILCSKPKHIRYYCADCGARVAEEKE